MGERDSLFQHRIRYLPRIIWLLWSTSPGVTSLVSLLSIISGLLVVAEMHILLQLVDTAQKVAQGSVPLLTGMVWGCMFVLLAALQRGMLVVSDSIGANLQESLRGLVEERCYQYVQRMPLERFELDECHDQLQRVKQGMERRLLSTITFLWRSLSSVVTLASLLAFIGQFHWGLPVLLITGTSSGMFIRERIHRRWFLLQRKHAPHERRFNTFADLLTGKEAAAEIRLFGFGHWLIQQATSLWQRLRQDRLKLAARDFRDTLLSDGLNSTAFVLSVVLSIWLLITGKASIGAYAAIFLAIQRFQSNYWSLAWNASVVLSDLRYIQDFFEFVSGPQVELGKGRTLARRIETGIVFEDVSFVYPRSEYPALSGINLRIHPGERIALVGENGAGKTTLAKLLMGLLRPTQGRILVDGVDLQEIAPANWYSRCSAVFQNFIRYQATVQENIGFGRIEQLDNDHAITASAKLSGAIDIVNKLDSGFDSLLGREFHEGQQLSVGQWQKLAIARAHLRQGDLLILDEPASALDPKTEAEVYADFAKLTLNRMAVLISHRIGSCRVADRIVVLKGGQKIEEGTHSKLLDANGEYAELYRLQAKWYL